MTSPSAALSVSGIEVPFGDADHGLSGVDFTVGRGERFALVGASGVGKTTLLHVLAGFVRPTAGRVHIEGADVTHRPVESRPVVLLTQNPVLFPHLSVFENVAFPLRVRGVRGPEVQRRVEEALHGVRLDGFGPRRPATLSGGQARRVALARAVVARPPVLLLDEPLSALDPKLREEVRSAILGVQAEYRPALVIVTHDLEEAGRIGDRIGVMIDGTLAQVGTPEQVFRTPATLEVARFVGLPNELHAELTSTGALLVPGAEVEVPLRIAGATSEGKSGSCTGPVVVIFGPDGAVLTPRPDGAPPAEGTLPGIVTAIRHYPDGAVAIVRCGTRELEVRIPSEGGMDAGIPVDIRLGGGSVHLFRRSNSVTDEAS